MEDPNEIHDFVNTNLKQEWEADLKGEGRSPGNDPWLQTLSKRRWRLEVVEADRIILDPNIMNSADPERGYSFQASLRRRRKELRTVIETFGVVIWPVVVGEEDMMLVDGYCRLTALRDTGISQVYSYLGRLQLDASGHSLDSREPCLWLVSVKPKLVVLEEQSLSSGKPYCAMMTRGDSLDRGVEAGAASGSLIGSGLGIVATILFFAYKGIWEQLGIHPLIALLIAALFSVLAIVAFQLGGITLGAALGIIFSLGYAKLPGRPRTLKGVLIGLTSWPIFLAGEPVLHFVKKPLTVDVLLSEFWWPLMVSIFGVLHGVYWQRLEKRGRNTFLRKLEKDHQLLLFDLLFALVGTSTVLGLLLFPYAAAVGYTGPLPAFITDPGSVVWIIAFLVLLLGLYMILGRTDWFEAKIAKVMGRTKEP